MSFGLQKLLHQMVSMQEMYREGNFAFSKPTPFTDNFWVNQGNEDSDEFVYLGDPAENRPTPLNVRGGEANMLTLADADKRRGILFHIFNGITFGKEVHEAIAEPSSLTLDAKGVQEVGRQMQHFRERHIITKELVLAKIVATGAVIFNAKTKEIKETAGADDITITLGVDASHQGDLGGLRQGTLFDDSWDIQAFFDRVDNAAILENSPPPTDVWVNAVNRNYILRNTSYQLWAAKNGIDSANALRGEVVENVFGKTWHFLTGGYKASTGSNTHYMPVDKLLLTAPTNTGWIKASNGAVLVPSSGSGLITDVEAAIRGEKLVYGPHAYACAEMKGGRVRYNGYAGDCFGLNFIEPGAIWQCTLTEESSS